MVAGEAIQSIPSAHGRPKDLLEPATPKKLDPISAHQLSRLARLHLRGYDDEMRVMARTVLEAALTNLGVTAGIVQRDNDAVIDDPPLAEFIEKLGRTGLRLLNIKQTRIANEIRWDANALVHNDVGHVRHYDDGGVFLRDLSEILGACMPEHTYTPPPATP